MGVLRKLAELVIEFPDGPKSVAGGKATAPEDDVLAQIERVQAELDSSLRSGPSAGVPKSAKPGERGGDPLAGGTVRPGKGGAASGSPPQAAAIDNPFEPAGGSAIALPSLLDITQIYAHAGLEPKDGELDIFRVEQMLADPEMADLDLSIRARTVKMTLKTMGKELHDILLDAARRDQALDAYGGWLGEAVQKVETQVAAENARLQREAEEFIAAKNAQIDANRQVAQQARAASQTFETQKAAEEQRLFDIAAPFVAPGENPVVVHGSATPREGDKQ